MRRVFTALLFAAGAAVVGCGPKKPFDGPTVDAFTGRLTHNGDTVTFPEDREVTLTVFFEKGNRFGIPIKSDGSFKIGWMPIGKYSAILEQTVPGQKGPPKRHNVPGGFTIAEGQTEYTIELGKEWKP